MRALVTGAGGLVGRDTVSVLRAAGMDVVPVVRAAPPSDPSGVVVDLARGGRPLLAAVAEPPEVVIHLAAAVPHWSRYPDNAVSAAATRAIDAAVLAAARQWGAALIYASTCGLYDPRNAEWKSESAPVAARTPYFGAKLDGEAAALQADAVVLRLAAPYGRGMSPDLVLARFVRTAAAGGSLEVWGSGGREQDFIAVGDVAAAVLAATQRRAAGVFNVASGEPITMKDLANLVVRTLGSGRVVAANRPDPQDDWTARYRIDAARIAFGWSPRSRLAALLPSLARELAA